MHKYITLFFSATLFLSACKDGKRSAEIIDHNRMISLLTEVHITDGGMFLVTPVPDSLYKYGLNRYLTLFKKFHTDSAQFRASMKYYTTQPVELQAMYTQILENLKEKTDSVNKIIQKNALRPDFRPR